MRFRLLPRDERFFTDLSAMADAIAEGAAVFEAMLAADPPALARAGEVQAIEHRCDEFTHDMLERLNRTFVTPIDREDIHALAALARRRDRRHRRVGGQLSLYRIDRVRPEARELAALITALGGPGAARGWPALERRKGVLEAVHEIKRLESEADASTARRSASSSTRRPTPSRS